MLKIRRDLGSMWAQDPQNFQLVNIVHIFSVFLVLGPFWVAQAISDICSMSLVFQQFQGKLSRHGDTVRRELSDLSTQNGLQTSSTKKAKYAPNSGAFFFSGHVYCKIGKTPKLTKALATTQSNVIQKHTHWSSCRSGLSRKGLVVMLFGLRIQFCIFRVSAQLLSLCIMRDASRLLHNVERSVLHGHEAMGSYVMHGNGVWNVRKNVEW